MSEKQRIDKLENEVNKLKNAVKKNTDISRASHFQLKGRISKLEKDMLSLSDRVAKLGGGQGDLEDLKENVNNLKRGLKNLWNAFKELKYECDKVY